MSFTTVIIAILALTGVYGQGSHDLLCGTRTNGGFPTWCPTEYVPVCALCPGNKLTNYMNMCFFNAARCERARDDWCELKHQGSCSDYDTHNHKRCATLYNPVCAECGENKTLRTFVNECYYYQYNDDNPVHLSCRFKSSGECNLPKTQDDTVNEPTSTNYPATDSTEYQDTTSTTHQPTIEQFMYESDIAYQL